MSNGDNDRNFINGNDQSSRHCGNDYMKFKLFCVAKFMATLNK
jgi:hypothetical protein